MGRKGSSPVDDQFLAAVPELMSASGAAQPPLSHPAGETLSVASGSEDLETLLPPLLVKLNSESQKQN